MVTNEPKNGRDPAHSYPEVFDERGYCGEVENKAKLTESTEKCVPNVAHDHSASSGDSARTPTTFDYFILSVITIYLLVFALHPTHDSIKEALGADKPIEKNVEKIGNPAVYGFDTTNKPS